jgi:hypothetical protein
MPKQLTIGIDFDNTWTASPFLFGELYKTAILIGFKVIIATGRTEFTDDMKRSLLPDSIPIVYCGKELKDIACKKAGYKVDIWIDDMPETIRQPLIDNLE